MTTARTAALSRPSGLTVLLAGAVAAALAIGALVMAWPSQAAGTFLVRGDVIKYDKTNGTAHVYFRHVNSAAEHYAGEVHEINLKNAKFYKYDSKQRKVASTFGSTLDNTGYEVVVRGTFDDSDQFKASWLVRNDNAVRVRGYVRGQSVTNNYLEVELDTVQYQATKKGYKTKQFVKGDTVRVYYDEDSTKFISRDGNRMNEDEISNNDEKITLEGIDVRFGGRFVADVNSTITDGKWKF